ncbi:MAG: endonuclease/exonuclease/phosphatase family protein, partial [Planctomycetota bacterium]
MSSSTASSTRRLNLLVALFVGLPILGVLGLTVLAWLAPHSYLGGPFCDVRWTAGLGSFGLALLALLARSPRWALLAALLGLLHCGPSWMLHLPAGANGDPEPGTELRVAALNVWIGNRNPKPTAAWIQEEKVDVVFLSELSLAIRPELVQRLTEELPYFRLSPSDPDAWNGKTWGRALFSRYPITEWEALDEHGKVLQAQLDLDGTSIQVIGAHANKPSPDYGAPLRDAELERIAAASRNEPSTIVLGDLNASTTTPSFRSLLKDGALRDSRQGFGRQPSWFSTRPVRGVHLAIDHVLVGRDWIVTDRRVGPAVGSDHRGVIAALVRRKGSS